MRLRERDDRNRRPGRVCQTSKGRRDWI